MVRQLNDDLHMRCRKSYTADACSFLFSGVSGPKARLGPSVLHLSDRNNHDVLNGTKLKNHCLTLRKPRAYICPKPRLICYTYIFAYGDTHDVQRVKVKRAIGMA